MLDTRCPEGTQVFHTPDLPPDVPPSTFHRWLTPHWEVWKLTWVTQLTWLIIYLVVVIVGWSIVDVRLAKAHEMPGVPKEH